MERLANSLADDRQRALRNRAIKARGWARLVYAVLVVAFLFAAWQERPLAPPVHDGMKLVSARVSYAMNNTDEVRAALRGFFSSPSGSSAKPEHDPVTRFLLQWER